MKKALALVLALVLALSLGVSAFALTFVKLDKEPSSSASKTPIVVGLDYDAEEEIFLAPSEGGTYYFELKHDGIELKNIEVTTNGPIAAEIVKFDADKMSGYGDGVWYLTESGKVVDPAKLSVKDKTAYDAAYKELKESGKYDVVSGYKWVKIGDSTYSEPALSETLLNNGTTTSKYSEKTLLEHYLKENDGDFDKAVAATLKDLSDFMGSSYVDGYSIERVYVLDKTSEAFNKALAAKLNEVLKTGRFDASTGVDGEPMLKVTVDANYTAAYKEASFKVTATRIDKVNPETGRVTESSKVVYEGTIISDVTIFEYEEVKWAGRNEKALVVGDNGYSDYYVNGNYGKVYIEEALRTAPNAAVVSTTAFRALREAKDGLSVRATEDILVNIPEIGAGQKGVNFSAYGVKFLNAKGIATTTRGTAVKAVFGFYGNQTIASDFTVEIDLGKDAYELREMFGEKVEEEDIITYYIVEDGKVAGQFTVDYMKDDIGEDIVLEINRKAGSTLGQYKVVLDVPAAPSKGEENPNTGAESVIGVVAAMSVVSVAAAAAVSLKK